MSVFAVGGRSLQTAPTDQSQAVSDAVNYNAIIVGEDVPTDGVNEVQRITITGTPTGGSFTLTYEGQTTGSIAYNASAANVQAALEAIPALTGNVTCSGGALPGSYVVVTFNNALGGLNVSMLVANASLTGGTSPAIAVTETTAGVQSPQRGLCSTGGTYVRTSATPANVNEYLNVGTPYTPSWKLKTRAA